jgi:hypothetical protein
MFLGIAPEVASWNKDNTAFSLLLLENPLIDFVELPPRFLDLQYCNILCGVLRGALEMVQMQVECKFVRDVLKGDEVSELRIELKGIVKSGMAEDYAEN